MSYSIIAKAVGPRCNLHCTYCYYLEKAALFADAAGGAPWLMSGAVLEAYVRQMFASPGTHPVEFVWQGGEPLLAGISFYENALRIQKQYAGQRPYTNVIQTNGTLLDDAWGAFLARNGFLAGVSLNGPAPLHDAYRVDKHGGGSFNRVMTGLRVLRKHGVDYNILATINRKNAGQPLETYRFLKEWSQGFLQFVPVVKQAAAQPAEVTPWSVTAPQFGEFYVAVYDEWVRQDVGKVFVQLFDATLAGHLGAPSPVCYYGAYCGRSGLLEHTGDVYACDHFVSPENLRGNILAQSLQEMLDSPEQHAFGLAKSRALPQECRDCPFLFACKGECPKNRFVPTAEKEYGKNYLCEGYKRFFEHSAATMRHMALLVRQGRPANEIMRWTGTAPPL